MGQEFPDGRLLMSKTRVKLFKGTIERKLPFRIQKAQMVATPTTLLTLAKS